jgi:hypothetical protein
LYESLHTHATATHQILLLLLRRASSTSDHLPVQRPISAIDTSFQNPSIYASNENLEHRRSSELRNRSKKRVSMDLTSKGTLSFHNISYVVGGRQENSRWKNWYPSFMKPEPEKKIIDDVSGIFISGMNAIMGKNSLFLLDFKTI